MIRELKTKDLTNFLYYTSQRDRYSDFYITRDNKRLFLNDHKVAKKVFNNCLKHGDKCLIFEESGQIRGILLLTGIADKFDRKYLKMFCDNSEVALGLIKALNWNYNYDLYVKLKKYNPLTEILLGTKNYNLFLKENLDIKRFRGFGFRYMGDRGQEGKEVFLYRKYNPRITSVKKEDRK